MSDQTAENEPVGNDAGSEETSSQVTGSQETIGATGTSGGNTTAKDPDEWVSGDDPMTGAQKSYLDTLARQAGEELPADLAKAEASQHIERLKSGSRGQSGSS